VTLRLVDAGWGAELNGALQADTSALRIICPFIKLGALERLLALGPKATMAAGFLIATLIAAFDLAARHNEHQP
jgi:hypothetical protein